MLQIGGNLNSNRYVCEVLQLKSFPYFKASLELSFSRIMPAHMFQSMFKTSVESNACNFFLGMFICEICCLLSMCGIWLAGILLVVCVLQGCHRRLFFYYFEYQFFGRILLKLENYKRETTIFFVLKKW